MVRNKKGKHEDEVISWKKKGFALVGLGKYFYLFFKKNDFIV